MYSERENFGAMRWGGVLGSLIRFRSPKCCDALPCVRFTFGVRCEFVWRMGFFLSILILAIVEWVEVIPRYA